MNRIRVLPEELVNQIAAGEVIDRPASVVKELVENSLDAGATYLEIDVDKGGIEKIEIRDNGQGMGKKDAQLAVKRYSTSKINSVDDLNQIKTFGFRGEALASIASVSNFSMKTKTGQTVEATEISVDGGKKPVVKTTGHPKGTTVIIKDLFFNVPARKKFMKTAQTEFKHIREFVSAQAICHPKIGFRLSHNNREIFHLPENQKIADRLVGSLNLNLDQFLPIDIKADYFHLKGFAGMPETARKKQPVQYLFINQRWLTNKTVAGAVYKAYSELVPPGIKPAYILKINIRQDLIDVNVHPRKEEIKFVSPGVIFETVYKSIYSKLSQTAEGQKRVYQSSAEEFSQKPTSRQKHKKQTPPITYHQEFIQSFFEDSQDVDKETFQGNIWQINNLYLVVPADDGLFIYDQHAAEERILFEQFKTDFKSKQPTRQELMFDEKISLHPDDVNLLKKQKQTLEAVGFRFKIKGAKAVVSGIPGILKDQNAGILIRDFLDELQNPEEEFQANPEETGIDAETLKCLTYLACRSAVKQGDKLPPRQRQEIIDKIDKLGVKGMTCPHGRPTYIKISLTELAKRFKRQ